MKVADLPPGPFGSEKGTAATADANRYLTDASGRRIATLWGSEHERAAMAALFIKAREVTP